MTQPNELRIGNLLSLNNPEHRPDEHGKILKVVGVTEEYPLVQLVHDPNRIMSFGQFWHFIDPIPLDESWLRRAGFVLSPYDEMVWENGPLTICYGYGSMSKERAYHYGHDYEKGNGYSCLYQPINYVHQLQNLFFALTGTELEFLEENNQSPS